MFQPIRNEKIYMMVIRQVRSLIENGKLTPGDRLPPERELAAMLAVSRTSVRQAISALEAVGVIEIRHGDGTYVAGGQTGDDVIAAFSRFLVINEMNPLEIIEARRIIEPEIARLCAERAEEEFVVRLFAQLERNRLERGDGASLSEMNNDFHLAVAEGSRNRCLIRLMPQIMGMMRHNMWPRVKGLSYMKRERAEEHLDQHEEIYAAIARHDGPASYESMRKHVMTIESEMESDVDSQLADTP